MGMNSEIGIFAGYCVDFDGRRLYDDSMLLF